MSRRVNTGFGIDPNSSHNHLTLPRQRSVETVEDGQLHDVEEEVKGQPVKAPYKPIIKKSANKSGFGMVDTSVKASSNKFSKSGFGIAPASYTNGRDD